MDIFEIIMNAVDDFDEKFENVLESLNKKSERIFPSDSIEEIEESEEIENSIGDNKKDNIIDIKAEYVENEDLED